MYFKVPPTLFVLISGFSAIHGGKNTVLDICGQNNGRRLFAEYGNSEILAASFENYLPSNLRFGDGSQGRCSVELITCPSCIIQLKFSFLNTSRNCGTSRVFDNCGCDYVLIHEPPFEDASGEQFCGRFIQNNISSLDYTSRTRSVAVTFFFHSNYGHAFTLEFHSTKNAIKYDGYPKHGQANNNSQIVTSPFFPHLYPKDLSVEYVIACHSKEQCRIRLIFTDFLVAQSSIVEFFDWNGQRMYVTTGNIFRPPIVITTGPNLTMKFYANGASNIGFKATYSFILENIGDGVIKANTACGGYVNNLGGAINMMNTVEESEIFFDCVWIVKPPVNYLFRKTHLYIKVVNFTNFAGATELIVRPGITSTESPVEVLRYPFHSVAKRKEHVVPIREGFYISLRGLFKLQSKLTIVYAAFNSKECFSGLDFLCHNLKCISRLLNCDGFDNCGDNSDEPTECSQDPRDRRQYSNIPNFLFPMTDGYSDLSTATFVFIVCTFGLMGIIIAMALLLYRVNVRARHQRQIHDHIETIHAILEEGVVEFEEEIITPDDPPDYEPPPEYTDVLKYLKKVSSAHWQNKKSNSISSKKSQTSEASKTSTLLRAGTVDTERRTSVVSASKSCQTTPTSVPESPPPAYENVAGPSHVTFQFRDIDSSEVVRPSTSGRAMDMQNTLDISVTCFPTRFFDDLGLSWRNVTKFKPNTSRKASNFFSFSEENLMGYFLDSFEIGKIPRSFSTDDISSL
ncbi:uncharacterized protein LOC132703346 [Cylas formicarius]|uniref:uncharacterized protein LOC132703346 n=1 Tax=Cylas formicarius TaxID=197179 RepID=UPI0029584809|nr:uncharacterized protein LOC132703346 [Cylas formicarius]